MGLPHAKYAAASECISRNDPTDRAARTGCPGTFHPQRESLMVADQDMDVAGRLLLRHHELNDTDPCPVQEVAEDLQLFILAAPPSLVDGHSSTHTGPAYEV